MLVGYLGLPLWGVDFIIHTSPFILIPSRTFLL